MNGYGPRVRLIAAALLLGSARAVAETPPEKVPPVLDTQGVAIEVPDPTPTGFLIAWKPALLSVRVDAGSGSKFGSDAIQPLRGLLRYTMRIPGDKLFFARFELEGGRFETENQGLGSTGTDFSGRVLVGTATRITAGMVLIASAGLLTRYEVGRSQTGAPRIGVFGVDSNIELDYRIAPIITVSGYLEGAITPFPYLAQSNLGDLSDADQVRFRVQLSIDITPTTSMDFGYDFTRWHAAFTNSTILNTVDRGLLVESREHAATLGLRFKMR